ncbi:polysaccharide pyruvyl transferase family protein [Clavibacter michiganensis]|uniref:polysaccharide pyruvyl transferase family protein n=1 Tax=Clavibacter michiganensis TaxID=28447 RepID=UPI0013767143|nr:polysaccharide pyruvyl transferase family protein [Clavibacter michiganensis]
MASTNLGDQIISDAVNRQFIGRLGTTHGDVTVIPMHGPLAEASRDALRAADEVVVCGTNLLSDHMRFRTSWEWPREDIELTKGKLTVFGAGWWQYQLAGIDPISARWLQGLAGGRTWAVRDEYSAHRLQASGVPAVHLSCPTLWDVRTQAMPTDQVRVIVTLTDYNQDPLADKRLVDLLSQRFEVLFWPQGPGDRRYIEQLVGAEAAFVEPSLAAFDAALDEPGTAYVGLRLHGGIRAMQRGVPSLILSIDNRAREISRSVGLHAPSRNSFRDVRESLESGQVVDIDLPTAAIAEWTADWRLS